MALFDSGSPKTLEDVLGQQADTATSGIEDAYAQKRKKVIGQQAALGRLGSGVANYPLGDLDSQEATDLSGVSGSLAQSLGQIPANDWLGTQDFNRNAELARYIASLQEPSTLEEVFGGIGAASKLAATVGAFKGG